MRRFLLVVVLGMGPWAAAWAALAPPGHLLVAMGDPTVRSHLASVDPRFGEITALNNAQVSLPRADPAGRMVLYTSVSNGKHVVSLVSLDHPSLDAILLQGKADDYAVCWLNPRAFLAVDGPDLCQVSLNGTIERRITRAATAPLRADVTRDGKTLFLQDGSTISRLDLETGKAQKLFPGTWPRLSHDGRSLVFIDGNRLLVYTLANHKTHLLVNLNTSVQAMCPAFSPDGSFIAWIAALPDGTAASVHIVSSDGHPVKALPLLAPADSLDWTR